MKKFIYLFSIFILPLFVIIIFGEVYVRTKNNLYKEKISGLISNKDSIEILILGNSHAFRGIDPNQFDQYAYNMAMVRQSLYFDKRITLKYINELKKLKYVFISIDFHSFYFSSQGARNKWVYKEYGVKYKDDDNKFNNISHFLFTYGPKVTFKILKTAVLQNDIKNENGLKKIDFNVQNGINLNDSIAKGWLSFESASVESFYPKNIAKRSNHFNLMVQNSNERDEIINDLKDFIFILKKNDITPILITPPCYSKFNQLLDRNFLNNNNLYIENICEELDVQYWNYLNEEFYLNEFRDSDHLNKVGAKRFSLMLNERIKTYKQN